MKTLFLLCWLCGFWLNPQQPATSSKPHYTVIRSNRLLELMTSELAPKNLRAVYKKDFRVKQTARNRHDPTVRDTLLIVDSTTDKLQIFKNKYTAHLLSATLTSQRLAFGHGIRIGATKTAFCQAFGLSAKPDAYEITDTPEGVVGISFLFKGGILVEVGYRVIYDVD